MKYMMKLSIVRTGLALLFLISTSHPVFSMEELGSQISASDSAYFWGALASAGVAGTMLHEAFHQNDPEALPPSLGAFTFFSLAASLAMRHNDPDSSLMRFIIPVGVVLGAPGRYLTMKLIKQYQARFELQSGGIQLAELLPFLRGEVENCCSICLLPWNYLLPASEVVRLTPCGHRFHRTCITTWFTGTKPSCPLCRAQ